MNKLDRDAGADAICYLETNTVSFYYERFLPYQENKDFCYLRNELIAFIRGRKIKAGNFG